MTVTKELDSRFTQRFPAFRELSAAIVPILRRNGQIFDSYGPYSDDPNDAERQNLWTRFEGEIACNSKRLVLLLEPKQGTCCIRRTGKLSTVSLARK